VLIFVSPQQNFATQLLQKMSRPAWFPHWEDVSVNKEFTTKTKGSFPKSQNVLSNIDRLSLVISSSA
jgi:hypothetical protein